MFEAIESKSLLDVDVVKLLIDIHARELEKYNSGIRQKLREYTVSSCATRLYAVVENFIETIISDYLDSLAELVSFSSLSDEFKNNYRIGFSYILSKIEQGRFDNLSHENVVEWYYDAIKDSKNYRFINQALTHHEQNFRLNIIESAFNKVQLKDFGQWITKHPNILALYSEEISIHDQLESEIKGFVQLRNDASHGTLDNLEGDENLLRLCELISMIIKAVSAYMRKSLIYKKLEVGHISESGLVTERFEKAHALVAKMKRGVVLKKEQKILVLDNSDCYYDKIETIMDHDNLVDEIHVETDDYEIGLRLTKMAKKNSKLFIIP